jgi:uncharacterized RDD family membrane protein YckC
MKTLQINTTQNVNIDFTLANEMQRVGAFLIDNVVKIAYIVFIYYIFPDEVLNDLEGDTWSFLAMNILICLPAIFYSLYLEILMNGQTIGKRLLGIRVVNIEGFKPSIADYIIRWFLRIVDFNLFFILVVYAAAIGWNRYEALVMAMFVIGKCIGIVVVAVSKKNQRVGDMSANTVVITTRDQAKFSHTILENLSDNYVPKYPNVIRLSDNDARIIKDTYTIAFREKDFNTLSKLRKKIEEVTDIKALESSDAEFIKFVLKDYNYYTQDM